MNRVRAWRLELYWGLPTAGFVAYLFYRWFAVRDRYEIFLYHHFMGAGFDTTPFGWVTVSRYWMAGLVASGAVLAIHGPLHLIIRQVAHRYRTPRWWHLWLVCATPLAVVIPAIVMTVNEPTLPLVNAAQVTLATLAGLAVAAKVAALVARGLGWSLRLSLDGLGLACLLGALQAMEHTRDWLVKGRAAALGRALAMLAVGASLTRAVTAVYRWRRRRREVPGAADWLLAGLAITYLVLPLYHHLSWCKDNGSWVDPDYFTYITDADNFFADSWLVQAGIWMVAGLVVVSCTRLRRRLFQTESRPARRPCSSGLRDTPQCRRRRDF
jgi:hypothetical protein